MRAFLEYLYARRWLFFVILWVGLLGLMGWNAFRTPKAGDPCYLGRGLPVGHLEPGAQGGLVCVVRFE